MTDQQTATDNALVEKLAFSLRDWKVGDRLHFPSLNAITVHEAAERIKSLLAEVDELKALRETMFDEHSVVMADRQRMRDALERAGGAMFDAFEGSTPTNPLRKAHRDLLEALNPASKEGCPVCGGDCSAANPPVLFCPMKDNTS